MSKHRVAPIGFLAAFGLAAAAAAFAGEDAQPAPGGVAVAAAPAGLEGASTPRQDVRKRSLLPASALGGDKPADGVDNQFEQYDAKAVETWWERYQWALEHAE